MHDKLDSHCLPTNSKNIELSNLKKEFETNDGLITVLDIPELRLAAGKIYGLVGPSGSGKSTLFSLLAGILKPTTGKIDVFGNIVSDFSQRQSSEFRLRNIGFIFQNFQLIDHLTAIENITLTAELLELATIDGEALLSQVGLSGKGKNFPHQLSGGEQQRVAVARAFITNPKLILADEPTGNLDSANAIKIQGHLIKLSREYGVTVIVATHDLDFAGKLDQVIELRAGQIA